MFENIEITDEVCVIILFQEVYLIYLTLQLQLLIIYEQFKYFGINFVLYSRSLYILCKLSVWLTGVSSLRVKREREVKWAMDHWYCEFCGSMDVCYCGSIHLSIAALLSALCQCLDILHYTPWSTLVIVIQYCS